MLIIPAIDIHLGKCVMLTQGKIEKETIYSNDPVFMAKMWQSKGAKRLHVVDLDGAMRGTVQHMDCIKQIREAFNGTLQVGGGIRNEKMINDMIELGIDRVILGTTMVYNPALLKKMLKKHGEKIIGAVDIVQGKVAIGGWKEITQTDAVEFAKELKTNGMKEIIVTDVTKDGMLEGTNIEDIRNIAAASGLEVIASGGIGSVDDVKKVKEIEKDGVTGVIIGKALYNESIKFEDLANI